MNAKASLREAKQLTAEQIAMLPATWEAEVDEEFLDSNGHMNVSWYLHLFNRATGGTYRWLGLDWKQLKQMGINTFALETHVRYFSELLVGERITIRTRLVSRTPKRVQLLHLMFNEDRQILSATHEEVIAHMDLSARKMTPFPDPLGQRIDEELAEHQALSWEPPVCGVMGA